MTKSKTCCIALVSLPFYSPFASCYQIEYLASVLRSVYKNTTCHHVHLDFSQRLLVMGETLMCKQLTSLRYYGDYLVLARMFPERSREILNEMLQVVPESRELNQNRLQNFYASFNGAIDACVDKFCEVPPDVIGISATHYQLIPSLLFAKRIKSRLPKTKIVVGGYLSSFETAQDLLSKHEYIDLIIYGEGETAIVEYITRMLQDSDGPRQVIRGARASRLTALPQYDSLIESMPRGVVGIDQISFSFELSRGCYWDKCDFCNFNAAYGKFRSFSFETTISEMDRLNAEYGISRFQFLDTSVPPKFASYLLKNDLKRPDYDIFCEIMVDFSYEQLESLRNFGVRRVQVGIESFSNSHLQSMKKNATFEDNVQCLEWCSELGITPIYGILVGRAGDNATHYRENAKLMCELHHLEPPRYISECDLRPDSPQYHNRQSSGYVIKFEGEAFNSVFSSTEFNCELRPSTVTCTSLESEDIMLALSEMRQSVDSWKQAFTS